VIRLPPPWTDDDGPPAGNGRDLLQDLALLGERRPAQLEDHHPVHAGIPRHVVYSAFSRT